jgi:hypothetical protein
MTGNTVKASENIQVDEEIIAFCSAYSSQQKPTLSESTSLPQLQSHESDLVNLDTVVPEPSLSNASFKHVSPQPPAHAHEPVTPAKKEKKRCKDLQWI